MWPAALLVAVGVLWASPASASWHTRARQLDVPPATAVVDVPPIPVSVPDTPVHQVLPSGPVVTLPSVQQLLPPLTELMAPAGSPPTGTNPQPSSSTAQRPLERGDSAPVGAGAATPGPSSITPPVETAVEGSQVLRPSTPDVDLTQEALNTAGRFWFPLVIAAALLAFVLIQWMIDRREPKLAASPLSDELLGFS